MYRWSAISETRSAWVLFQIRHQKYKPCVNARAVFVYPPAHTPTRTDTHTPHGLVPCFFALLQEQLPPIQCVLAALVALPVPICGIDPPVNRLRFPTKSLALREVVIHTLDGPRGPLGRGQLMLPAWEQGIGARGPLPHDLVHFSDDGVVDRAEGENDVHPLAASVHVLLELAVVRINVARDGLIR